MVSAFQGGEQGHSSPYVVRDTQHQHFRPFRAPRLHRSPSYGLGKPEIQLASAAAHIVNRLGRPLNRWAVLNPQGQSEPARRLEFRKFKSEAAQLARRAGAPFLCLEVLECETDGTGLHSNCLMHMPCQEGIGRLARRYDDRAPGDLHVAPIHDVQTLIGYLSKQATPQAHYGLGRGFVRQPGSHPIVGDRLRLSDELACLLHASGEHVPVRTYHTVAKSIAEPVPEAIGRPHPREGVELVRAAESLGEGLGQAPANRGDPLQLTLPGIVPSVIDFREFWSGRVPKQIATEIETRRKALGLSQKELGRRVGLSQPQIANALAGRFGLGRVPVNRLQSLLLDAERTASAA